VQEHHTSSPRLYVVVRADLSRGLQIAQSVHAAFHFSAEHPDLVGPWLRDSNFLVVCSVPTEGDLMDLISAAHAKGIERSAVREPDLDDEITAVAFAPGDAARRLCSALPLALREVAMT
jgi:peptidyl-tRNA hydrolase